MNSLSLFLIAVFPALALILMWKTERATPFRTLWYAGLRTWRRLLLPVCFCLFNGILLVNLMRLGKGHLLSLDPVFSRPELLVLAVVSLLFLTRIGNLSGGLMTLYLLLRMQSGPWQGPQLTAVSLLLVATTMIMLLADQSLLSRNTNSAGAQRFREFALLCLSLVALFTLVVSVFQVTGIAIRLREVFHVLVPVRVLTCFLLILILLWVYICFGLGRSSLPLVALPTVLVTGLLSGLSIEVLAIPFAIAMALFLSVPENRALPTGRQSFPTR